MRMTLTLSRAGCGLVAGGLLMLQPGGTTTSALVERLNAASMRPLPAMPQRETPRTDAVWVPDRYLSVPGTGSVAHVPGHWERRISDREFFVPPLVIFELADRSIHPVPAGIRMPPESRVGP